MGLNEIVPAFAIATGSSFYRTIALADAFMVTGKVPKMRISNERRREEHRERGYV